MNKMLIKEINILKKKLNLKNEKSLDEFNDKQLKEYIDKKIEEAKKEFKKILEEKIKEKDNEIKEEINQLKEEQEKLLNQIQHKDQINPKIKIPLVEKDKKEIKKNQVINFNKFEDNDNVNLINDFNSIKIENMKVSKVIAINLKINYIKSVAVYKIKRNNENLI